MASFEVSHAIRIMRPPHLEQAKTSEEKILFKSSALRRCRHKAELTKKEHWLGGFRKGGEPYMTLDALRGLLTQHFVMLDAPQDVEFVQIFSIRSWYSALQSIMSSSSQVHAIACDGMTVFPRAWSAGLAGISGPCTRS
jgi:hypothetical protein